MARKFDVLDISGGLIEEDSQPSTLIPSKFWSRLHNVKAFGRYIKRRPGIAKVLSAPYSEELTALFASNLSTGDWTLYAGGLTGIAKMYLGSLTALPVTDGVAYASQPYPWHSAQRNDVIYWARRGTGTLKRSPGDSIQNAGIDAPATAPTIADGGAGVLAAANYYAVYTYYNSLTGAESNPSPASTVLALGASRQITWSGLVNSTNGQVDSMRLYRVTPGQTGEYYLVATVTNFVSAYATDNVEPGDLGDRASYQNGLPPDLVEVLAIWGERMWLSDGTDLFFSPPGMMESFDQEENVLNVYRQDGHKIRALHPFGDKLLIGKTNAVHYVSGVEQFSIGTLTDRHGCVAPLSMKSALGTVFWYSGENVYSSDGINVKAISDKNLKSLMERVPEALKENVCAAIYPKENEYRISFPVDAGTNNSVEAVYNYRDNTWVTRSYSGDTVAPRAYGDFYDENYNQLIYAVTYDNEIYDMDSGVRDADTAITCVAETPDYGMDENALKKGIRFVHLLCSTVTGSTLTLKAYLNQSSSAFKTRTGLDLSKASPWKKYNLSTMGQVAATVRVGIEYTGDEDFQLNAYALDVGLTEREEKAA